MRKKLLEAGSARSPFRVRGDWRDPVLDGILTEFRADLPEYSKDVKPLFSKPKWGKYLGASVLSGRELLGFKEVKES